MKGTPSRAHAKEDDMGRMCPGLYHGSDMGRMCPGRGALQQEDEHGPQQAESLEGGQGTSSRAVRASPKIQSPGYQNILEGAGSVRARAGSKLDMRWDLGPEDIHIRACRHGKK